MSDNVNHPSHYTKGGIECIEAIKASMSSEGFQDYCKGNVIKYIWRWRDKASVEDLKKAQVYLSWLIESAEKDKPKDVLVESVEKDQSKNVFVYYVRGNGKKLKLEHAKVDPGSLDDYVRDYYFHSLVEELRVCSSPRSCFECLRNLSENGCDSLESDAADAIEFLLKELEKKEDPKKEKKEGSKLNNA